MTNRTLAIIPARGGSKRIPGKNIRDVAGKPLIAHTIEQATDASQIDRAIISTDDKEIANVAKKYGGDVPFMRPDDLAGDSATLANTVTHAIDSLERNENKYDQVCVLQVTSPLRTPRDINGTLTKLIESEADSCLTVSEYLTPPQWALTKNQNGTLFEYFDFGMLWTDDPDRSQDIPELYHPNGAVFATTKEAWRKYKTFYTPQTVGYEMPPERSFDIDVHWELELVRKILE